MIEIVASVFSFLFSLESSKGESSRLLGEGVSHDFKLEKGALVSKDGGEILFLDSAVQVSDVDDGVDLGRSISLGCLDGLLLELILH